MKKNVWYVKFVSLHPKRFGKRQRSFIASGSEKKWYCISEDSPQEVWGRIVERMLDEFAEIQCPIFRVTSPLSRSQFRSKRTCESVDTFCSRLGNECEYLSHSLFWQTSSVFTEQSRRCVKNTNLFTREWDPLSENNPVPHSCQVWSRQKYFRIVMTLLAKIFCCNNVENELKSHHDKTDWVNFVRMEDSCMFLKSDSISWRKTAELSQFTDAVVCREYTLPRDEDLSEPTGWFRGNIKIGPVLEVASCCLHGKYGVEIRIMSLNKDNFLSWVRFSHGLTKLVTDLNQQREGNLRSEVRKLCFWNWLRVILNVDQRAKQNHKDENLPVRPQEQYLLRKEFGPMVESGEHSISDYAMSKKLIHLLRQGNSLFLRTKFQKELIHLLRHSQKVHREEDGAVHFWRIKEHLQSQFAQTTYWSHNRWKACLAAWGAAKRIHQYCTDGSGIIVYFRALSSGTFRTQFHWFFIARQCCNSGRILPTYSPYWMFNLHSIINSGLTLGGQSLSKIQTVFFLLVDLRDKTQKGFWHVRLGNTAFCTIHAQNMETSKYCVGSTSILFSKEGLKFYQTRLNAIILHETLPAHCIPKFVRMETGEVLYEKVYMSPRFPPKISLKHEWKRELVSKRAQTIRNWATI